MSETKTCTSVKDYGVFSDQNWQHRRKMEDAHCIQDGFANNPKTGFFGIYDGHGGKEAAIFSSNNLHKILYEQMQSHENIFTQSPETFKEVLSKTFEFTDERMKASGVPTHHGCTAVACVITGEGESHQVFCANVGDTRAILSRKGQAIRITQDHTASNEEEAKRIQAAGGFIINGRVNGQIVITRSLGDHLMKDYIIGKPHVYHSKLTEDDEFLVLACDGLWDVVEDQRAADFVKENIDQEAGIISKKLLALALKEGSTDNLTVIVVKLK